MSQKTDMAYGRQGGRVVEGKPVDLSKARRCEECGHPMHGGQRRRHFLCDPESLVGRRCVCPPGCTDVTVGDGPRGCDPGCAPCRLTAGQPYSKVRQWQTAKKTA